MTNYRTMDKGFDLVCNRKPLQNPQMDPPHPPIVQDELLPLGLHQTPLLKKIEQLAVIVLQKIIQNAIVKSEQIQDDACIAARLRIINREPLLDSLR